MSVIVFPMNAIEAKKAGTDIGEISWTELNQYELVMYPDHLTVITNADRHNFNRAVNLVRDSHEEGEGLNIESALNELGFAAVACSRPKKIPVIQF